MVSPTSAHICMISGTDVLAVCALSSDSERAYLAYPSPAPTSASSPLSAIPSAPTAPSAGDVLLFDTKDNTALNVIQAHKAPIAALALNATGTMLATASDKGTVVRVFSVPGAQKLWQFRRGSQSARIFSLNFNLASSLLAVSSDSSTIHIYRLASRSGAGSGGGHAQEPTSPGFDDAGSVAPSEISSSSPPPNANHRSDASAAASLRKRSYHIGKSLVGGVGGYLPKSMSEMWEPQRDFAYIKLRNSGARTVVAMSPYVLSCV
jgi:autophagy-related protein 18